MPVIVAITEETLQLVSLVVQTPPLGDSCANESVILSWLKYVYLVTFICLEGDYGENCSQQHDYKLCADATMLEVMDETRSRRGYGGFLTLGFHSLAPDLLAFCQIAPPFWRQ